MPYDAVPGVVETREAYGETTLVVDPARLLEACSHLRDEGFNVLSDVTPTDYLGWGERGVGGLHRHAGRAETCTPPARRVTRAGRRRSRSASRSTTTC